MDCDAIVLMMNIGFEKKIKKKMNTKRIQTVMTYVARKWILYLNNSKISWPRSSAAIFRFGNIKQQ